MGLMAKVAKKTGASTRKRDLSKRGNSMKQQFNSDIIYSQEALLQHYGSITKTELLQCLLNLGKEGKVVINVLNQNLLAKKLGGIFVGDEKDDWDIEVQDLKIELKSQVNLSAGTYAGTVGFASWKQKEGWDYLIHYLPQAFNNFIDEDKFVLFSWDDREKMLEYSSKDGTLQWAHTAYNHSSVFRRNHAKMKWIIKRIHNFDSLKKELLSKDSKTLIPSLPAIPKNKTTFYGSQQMKSWEEIENDFSSMYQVGTLNKCDLKTIYFSRLWKETKASGGFLGGLVKKHYPEIKVGTQIAFPKNNMLFLIRSNSPTKDFYVGCTRNLVGVMKTVCTSITRDDQVSYAKICQEIFSYGEAEVFVIPLQDRVSMYKFKNDFIKTYNPGLND
jgi:hypothetical protein